MSTPRARPPGPIGGDAAWRADRLDAAAWCHHLRPEELAELDRAQSAVHGRGADLAQVDREQFPLPTLGPRLLALRDQMLHGRGFVVLRGLDLSGRDRAAAATIFWGIGAHLGRAVPQNARGHLLGHVTDLGRSAADPTARIYQTAERQGFHTDSADLVGLLCLARAREGGRSALVSCAAIHDELLRRCPELLGELFEPFSTDHRGEEPPGTPPYFTAPILSWYEGRLSVLYQRRYIESAQRFDGVPQLTARQIAALDALDAVAEDPALCVQMDLQPGDMQFVHNHALLHDRTAFRDDPAHAVRRHLLRLWLCPDQGRPLPPWFAQRLRSTAIGARGGIALRGVAPVVPLDPES